MLLRSPPNATLVLEIILLTLESMFAALVIVLQRYVKLSTGSRSVVLTITLGCGMLHFSRLKHDLYFLGVDDEAKHVVSNVSSWTAYLLQVWW